MGHRAESMGHRAERTEVGLRPVGGHRAYAPEGMGNAEFGSGKAEGGMAEWRTEGIREGSYPSDGFKIRQDTFQ
jgi:hypothetical protein